MENNLYAPKPRGRPIGSKNKRKEPEMPFEGIGHDSVAMQLKVLEVAVGADIIRAVSDFANHFKVEVSVVSTHGLVHDVCIFRPRVSAQTSSVFRYGGIYDLLSLKGTFHGSLSPVERLLSFPARHLIYFVVREGHSVGGLVSGRVIAASKVFLGVVIMRETDCIKLPIPPPCPFTLFQPEICSSSRGSMTNGAPYPTPLRSPYCNANGLFCVCSFK